MRIAAARWMVGIVAVLAGSNALGQALTPRFTYQGRLDSGGVPASGLYDMRFGLYNAAVGGTIQGTTLCVDNVSVADDGTFTASLDFGSVFDGNERYLQIDVRADTGLTCSTASGYTTLTRQRLTATPYASHALFAGTSLKPWTPLGTTATRFDGTFVGINATTPVTTNGVFQVSRLGAGAGGFGGMWVTTDNATGRPFYGYNNTSIFNLVYHYLDGADNSWRLFVGSDVAMTVLPTGRTGLGTTTPTERLHVAGNVLATGTVTASSFAYGAPVTRTLTIGTAGWSPDFGDTVAAGNGARSTRSDSPDRIMHGVNLPDGCRLRRVIFHLLDNNASSNLVARFRSETLGAFSVTTHASVQTAGSSGSDQVFAISLNLVIDGSRIYYLDAAPTGTWQTLQSVRGVQFEYSLDGP